MKFSILTTAILLSATLDIAAQAQLSPATRTTQPAPGNQSSQIAKASQPDSLILNTQLQQAVCGQDWRRAINVVDRMIGVVSRQRGSAPMLQPQLIAYRGQLQGLLRTKTVLPATSMAGCATVGATTSTQQPVSTPSVNTPAGNPR